MDSNTYPGGSLHGAGSSFGNDSYLKNNFTVREDTRTSHGQHQQQQQQLHSVHPLGGTSALPPSQSSIPVRISTTSVKEIVGGGGGGSDERFPIRLVYNVGREVYLHVFRSVWAPPEISRPLDKQLFKGPPTCHDLSCEAPLQLLTSPATPVAAQQQTSSSSLGMLIGFFSGCVLYCDPLKRENSRFFNEDRSADNTKVSCVKWLPGSDSSQFVAAHASGVIFVYSIQLPSLPVSSVFNEVRRGVGYSVHVSKPINARNPCAKWVLDGGVNDMAFSPCGRYIAFARRDGILQVFTWSTHELIGASRSYFGGLLCCAWSHDSKFVAVAGEDDLVHVWSFDHCRLIARCRGHRSWVSRIAWDPCNSYNVDDAAVETSAEKNGKSSNRAAKQHAFASNYHERSSRQISDDFGGNAPSATAASVVPPRLVYRFASVGQDTQLCVWELTEDVINQVLFPSKARNSFVIPVDSDLLKRGGRRFAFRAAAAAAAAAASTNGETGRGSGSSSLASSTRSNAGTSADNNNKSIEPVVVAPVLVQSGRRFRFPLGFMRRSSPNRNANKKTNTKSSNVDGGSSSISDARENDSNSTLLGISSSDNNKTPTTSILGDPISSISAVTPLSAAGKRPPGDEKTPGRRRVPAPVTRSSSAYEPRRLSSTPQRQKNVENDDDDDDDDDASDGPVDVQLMSDGEALDRANVPTRPRRANGGALSVDSATMPFLTTNMTSTTTTTTKQTTTPNLASSGKKKKRRQFSLMRLAGVGRSDTTVGNSSKKVESHGGEPSTVSAAGDAGVGVTTTTGTATRRLGRRVAAHLFSAAANSSNSNNAADSGDINRLGTPECPRLDDIPMLEPIMCKSIANERLTDIVFLDECMLIATQDGVVQVWGRPELLVQSGHDRRLGSVTSRTAVLAPAATATTTAGARAVRGGSGNSKSSSSRTSSYGSQKDYRTSRVVNTTSSSTAASAPAPARVNPRIPLNSGGGILNNNNSVHEAVENGEENEDDLVEEARYGQQAMFSSNQLPSTSSSASQRSRYANGTNNNNTAAATGVNNNNMNDAVDDDDEDDELINLDTQSRNNNAAVQQQRRRTGAERGFLVSDATATTMNGPTKSATVKVKNKGNLANGERALINGVSDSSSSTATITGGSSSGLLSNSRDSESTLVNSFAEEPAEERLRNTSASQNHVRKFPPSTSKGVNNLDENASVNSKATASSSRNAAAVTVRSKMAPKVKNAVESYDNLLAGTGKPVNGFVSSSPGQPPPYGSNEFTFSDDEDVDAADNVGRVNGQKKTTAGSVLLADGDMSAAAAGFAGSKKRQGFVNNNVI